MSAAAAEAVRSLSFGCRLNGVEAETMARMAQAGGHRDLTIVNTCAVTAEAVRQSRQAIRRLKREEPARIIAVTGCAATIEPARFAAMPEVGRVVPNPAKTDPATWRTGAVTIQAEEALAGAAGQTTRGFVAVQTGCDHACTFCIIPAGRGASRSEAPDAIVARIAALAATGVKDVVLTGVDITAYGLDHPDWPTLGGLVRHILDAVPDLPRLRLSSLDCIEADPALIAVLSENTRLMPHLHLSLQSGSDLILKRMRRRHTRAEAVAFCAALRAARPDIVFGADLITGFPTETEAHFADSLALVEACGLTHLHVFPFSARPGTPAARMPQVPAAESRRRAALLRAAGEAALRRHLDRQVGRTLPVLAERGGRGRAPDFTPVRLDPAPPAGTSHGVAITGHDGRELLGTPLAGAVA